MLKILSDAVTPADGPPPPDGDTLYKALKKKRLFSGAKIAYDCTQVAFLLFANRVAQISLRGRHVKKLLGTVAVAALISSPALAIEITATDVASDLEATLGGGGITITGSTLSTPGSGTTGTFTNLDGTFGLTPGIVLSTGLVTDYESDPTLGGSTSGNNSTAFGVSATGAQEALLDPITGGSLNHNDVTEFTITFDVDGLTDAVFFDLVFGSEEFDDFLNSSFIDAFGIYLNGTNIAIFNGDPVNIDHPDFGFLTGTELNGYLLGAPGDPLLSFGGMVTPGSTGNELTFIIADSGDSSLDSTVYISGLDSTPGGGNPGGGNVTVSEPGMIGLFGLGLLGLGFAARRRRG
ncbi:MAG: choice-of-anchor L domain-containing protein [Pseudomonadota bacterium]